MWDNLFGNGWRPRRESWLGLIPLLDLKSPWLGVGGGIAVLRLWMKSYSKHELNETNPFFLSPKVTIELQWKRFFFTHPFNKACYLNLHSLEMCAVPQNIHIPPISLLWSVYLNTCKHFWASHTSGQPHARHLLCFVSYRELWIYGWWFPFFPTNVRFSSNLTKCE